VSGRRLRRRLRAAGLGASVVRGVTRRYESNPAEDLVPDRWARQNYRGRTVDLRGGLALAGGLLAGMGAGERRDIGAGVAAIGTAAAAGLWDDAHGDAQAKGLGGHLKAVRAGRVTTGLVKLVAIGAGALAAAALEARPVAGRGRVAGLVGGVGQVVADAALIAGAANLANLFDLRPGRALKVAALPAAALVLKPGEGGPPAAGVLAAIGAALPSDLEERTMLGDCGANALGAALGLAAVRGLSPQGRLAALAGVTGLTLASEKVSFSRVIAGCPVLAWWDGLGRLPAGGDVSAR
jgi:hypothetical protein